MTVTSHCCLLNKAYRLSYQTKLKYKRNIQHSTGGKRSFSNDEEVKGNITAQPANLTGNASVKVGKIGDLTPVQCFEALI